MKNLFFLLVATAITNAALAQDTLVTDSDHDKIADTVLLNRDEARIVCWFSTQKFKKYATKRMMS